MSVSILSVKCQFQYKMSNVNVDALSFTMGQDEPSISHNGRRWAKHPSPWGRYFHDFIIISYCIMSCDIIIIIIIIIIAIVIIVAIMIVLWFASSVLLSSLLLSLLYYYYYIAVISSWNIIIRWSNHPSHWGRWTNHPSKWGGSRRRAHHPSHWGKMNHPSLAVRANQPTLPHSGGRWSTQSFTMREDEPTISHSVWRWNTQSFTSREDEHESTILHNGGRWIIHPSQWGKRNQSSLTAGVMLSLYWYYIIILL